jgi:hypothetical protein
MIATGSVKAQGKAGNIDLVSCDSVSSYSSDITMRAGNTTGSNNKGVGGDVNLFAGWSDEGFGGNINLLAGSGSLQGGNFSLASGASDASSGNLLFSTDNAHGDSGDILLNTGTTISGNSGKIKLESGAPKYGSAGSVELLVQNLVEILLFMLVIAVIRLKVSVEVSIYMAETL